MNLNKTENTFVLGIFLAATGLVAALVLAYFSKLTAEPITRATAENANKALASVVPPFKNKKSTVFENIRFTAVYNEYNVCTGIAGETSVKGYGGEIKTLVGINPDGSIRTVIITEQNETPGLGSNVCVRKETKTLKSIFSRKNNVDSLPPNKILDYYSGKSLEKNNNVWQITKDGGNCPYITGATVSSRAVCRAVYNIISTYTENRAAINAGFTREK